MIFKQTLEEKNPFVTRPQDRKVIIEPGTDWIDIKVEGYGNATVGEGHECLVALEVWNGKLRVVVYGDINSEEPTHIIPLEVAREELRKKNG